MSKDVKILLKKRKKKLIKLRKGKNEEEIFQFKFTLAGIDFNETWS